MEPNAYKDFDQFFGEVEQAPTKTLKLYDKVYSLPIGVPASIMLDSYKMFKAGVEVVDEVKQFEITQAILGKENVEEWCEKGMTTVQLNSILKWAVGKEEVASAGGSGKK